MIYEITLKDGSILDVNEDQIVEIMEQIGDDFIMRIHPLPDTDQEDILHMSYCCF